MHIFPFLPTDSLIFVETNVSKCYNLLGIKLSIRIGESK